VDAPAAVRVVFCPEQISAGEAVADTAGSGFTVTLTEALEEHPADVVPVTEYVVDVAGLTVMGEPVAPVFQEYDDAPPAEREALCPEHTVAGAAVAVIAGIGFTVTLTETVEEQPDEVVPVTA